VRQSRSGRQVFDRGATAVGADRMGDSEASTRGSADGGDCARNQRDRGGCCCELRLALCVTLIKLSHLRSFGEQHSREIERGLKHWFRGRR